MDEQKLSDDIRGQVEALNDLMRMATLHSLEVYMSPEQPEGHLPRNPILKVNRIKKTMEY